MHFARLVCSLHSLSNGFMSYVQVEAHEDDVNAVSFADEGSQILFSGSDDGLCKVTIFSTNVLTIESDIRL